MTPALQPALDSRHRLAGHGALFPDPPHPHQQDAQRVQAALVHQRAGHDFVIDEVALDEPLLGLDVVLRADEPEAEAPARGIEQRHAIDEAQHPRRELHRVLQRQADEPRTEGRAEVAAMQRRHLIRRERALLEGNEIHPIGGSLPRHRLSVELRVNDSLPRRERLRRKEAGDAVGHAQQRFAVDSPFEPETEEPRVGLAEELVDADVVLDALADARQLSVERHHGVEQAVDGEALRPEVDAEKTGEKQVGLARFDRDARGASTVVEVPAPGVNGVVGDDPAPRHRLRLALDVQHTVDEHQRTFGQSHPRRELVDFCEERSEHAVDFPDGVFGALLEAQGARYRERIDGHGDRFDSVATEQATDQVILKLQGGDRRLGQSVLNVQKPLVGFRDGGLRRRTPGQHGGDGVGPTGESDFFPARNRRLLE